MTDGRNTGKSKSFGASKALVIRALKHGYRPAATPISVAKPDVVRLRKWARSKHLTLTEAFSEVLTAAGLPPASTAVDIRRGRCSELIEKLLEKDKFPSVVLGKVKRGDYDEVIRKSFSQF